MTVPMHNVPQGTTFRGMVRSISYPPLANNFGYRYMYSIAIQWDAISEYLRLGVLARMPGFGTEEALPFSGNDRQILRGQAESTEGYVARLQQAYPTWRTAGNAQSVLKQIAGYFAGDSLGVPKLRYVVNGEDENGNRFADWWTLENGTLSYHRSLPNNWNWDNTWDQVRFWVIVYRKASLVPWRIGDGHTIGQHNLFIGFEATDDVTAKTINDVRALINKWKCAGSHAWIPAGIIFADETLPGLFDPTSPPGPPMPDGTWGNPANRNTNAFYLSGI